jgi:hypothetical protein
MTQKTKIKTIGFRILKWIAIILVIFCVIIYFLNQGIKSKYCGFHRLDKDSIDNIVMYKFKSDTLNYCRCSDSMILSKNQINRFARKWNNSYPVGLYKYLPSFTLTVKMKNGRIRDFRIGGRNIKEDKDWSYRFLFDDSFFESIWDKK